MEHLRETNRGNLLAAELDRQQTRAASVEEAELKQRMLDCLERCTSRLEANSREIITRYYIGKERIKIENRRSLARDLGITMNALSIRACRIRDKLEACVKECTGTK